MMFTSSGALPEEVLEKVAGGAQKNLYNSENEKPTDTKVHHYWIPR
jgi:hypothetical protein